MYAIVSNEERTYYLTNIKGIIHWSDDVDDAHWFSNILEARVQFLRLPVGSEQICTIVDRDMTNILTVMES